MSELPKKHQFKKKSLGSYPYISVVFSITLALFVIGVFASLVIYSKELERVVRENVKIQVYLKNSISETQRDQIEKSIASKPFVAKVPQSIEFVSKEKAAKDFITETGEDFRKFLGDNPLKDAFLVRIDENFHDSENLKKIKSEIESMGGVFEVYYVENVINSINQNLTKIGIILLSLVALLLLIVVLLINNTLRLALFSQRFLIRSMQLVGARSSFIQKPFLIRAGLHGFISGIIASSIVIALLVMATKRIEELTLIQNNDRLIALIISLIIIGVIVAVASTYRAVSKYLKLSLDELY